MDSTSKPTWRCRNCSNQNRASAVICYTCGDLREVDAAAGRKKKKKKARSSYIPPGNEPLLVPVPNSANADRTRDSSDSQQQQDYTPPVLWGQEQPTQQIIEEGSFVEQDYNDVMQEISRRHNRRLKWKSKRNRNPSRLSSLESETDDTHERANTPRVEQDMSDQIQSEAPISEAYAADRKQESVTPTEQNDNNVEESSVQPDRQTIDKHLKDDTTHNSPFDEDAEEDTKLSPKSSDEHGAKAQQNVPINDHVMQDNKGVTEDQAEEDGADDEIVALPSKEEVFNDKNLPIEHNVESHPSSEQQDDDKEEGVDDSNDEHILSHPQTNSLSSDEQPTWQEGGQIDESELVKKKQREGPQLGEGVESKDIEDSDDAQILKLLSRYPVHDEQPLGDRAYDDTRGSSKNRDKDNSKWNSTAAIDVPLKSEGQHGRRRLRTRNSRKGWRIDKKRSKDSIQKTNSSFSTNSDFLSTFSEQEEYEEESRRCGGIWGCGKQEGFDESYAETDDEGYSTATGSDDDMSFHEETSFGESPSDEVSDASWSKAGRSNKRFSDRRTRSGNTTPRSSGKRPIWNHATAKKDESDYPVSRKSPLLPASAGAPVGDLSATSPQNANSVGDLQTCEEEEKRLQRLASLLSPTWFGQRHFSKEYASRLVNFKYAQEKRREMYGYERPWGILGLYEHLAAIRTDIQWAEEVERRKESFEPHISWAEFDEQQDDYVNAPFFTYLLLIVCTITLIESVRLNGWQFEPLSENPTLGPSAETLIRMGAKDSNLIVNGGETWRLITPMFLHAGCIHYVINMIALNAIGKAVEQSHGSFAAAIMFCLPAVGGTIVSAIFLPDYISVGASGGIFGLIGACLADIIIHWSLLFGEIVNGPGGACRHVFIVLVLLLDISFNCIIGLTPFVDNWNHMGGMLYGIFCACLTMDRIKFTPSSYIRTCCREKVVPFLGALIIFGGMLASTIVLFTGDGITPPCPACQSVSCVEFPPWEDIEGKWWYCDHCAATSADARVDEGTGLYDYLNINCPDGEVVELDLGDDATDDKEYLQEQLPLYCRMYCNDTFG